MLLFFLPTRVRGAGVASVGKEEEGSLVARRKGGSVLAEGTRVWSVTARE